MSTSSFIWNILYFCKHLGSFWKSTVGVVLKNSMFVIIFHMCSESKVSLISYFLCIPLYLNLYYTYITPLRIMISCALIYTCWSDFFYVARSLMPHSCLSSMLCFWYLYKCFRVCTCEHRVDILPSFPPAVINSSLHIFLLWNWLTIMKNFNCSGVPSSLSIFFFFQLGSVEIMFKIYHTYTLIGVLSWTN